MTFAHARSSSCLASVLHRCSSFSWSGACFPVSSCDILRKRFMFKPSPCMNDQIGHLSDRRSHQRLVDVPIGQRGGTAARSETTIDNFNMTAGCRAWRKSVAHRFRVVHDRHRLPKGGMVSPRLQSHLPPAFHGAPYDESGWCFVEACSFLEVATVVSVPP